MTALSLIPHNHPPRHQAHQKPTKPVHPAPGLLFVASKVDVSHRRPASSVRRRQVSQPASDTKLSTKQAPFLASLPPPSSLPSAPLPSRPLGKGGVGPRKAAPPAQLKHSRKALDHLESMGHARDRSVSPSPPSQRRLPKSDGALPGACLARSAHKKATSRCRARSASSPLGDDPAPTAASHPPASLVSSPIAQVHRSRTVTLDNHPVKLVFSGSSQPRKLLEVADSPSTPPKAWRSKKCTKPNAQRAAKPVVGGRVRPCSSDESEPVIAMSSDPPSFVAGIPTDSPLVSAAKPAQTADHSVHSVPPLRFAGTCSKARAPRPRRHARARSVASVLDMAQHDCEDRSYSAKGDWDMPRSSNAKDLTWQQAAKHRTQSLDSDNPTPGRLGQKLAQYNAKTDVSHAVAHQPPALAGVPFGSTAVQRNMAEWSGVSVQPPPISVSAPSSASLGSRVLSAQLPPQGHFFRPVLSPQSTCLSSSDAKGMTWQQAIMKSPIKPLSGPVPTSDGTTSRSENLHDSVHASFAKKNYVTGVCTPRVTLKSMISGKKNGCFTVPKSSTVGPAQGNSFRRRNSMSSERLAVAPPQNPAALSLAHEVIGPGPVCTKPDSCRDRKLANRCSTPLPQVSHAFGDMSTQHFSAHHSNAPQQAIKMWAAPLNPSVDNRLITPNKSKSTSELSQLLTPAPGKVISKSYMYAGPQFHNSPSPAALPAPKFVAGA